jgi:hypothetical protein
VLYPVRPREFRPKTRRAHDELEAHAILRRLQKRGVHRSRMRTC